jgi:CTP synthase
VATKYIFVTGGVLSGVGKGITAASIGALLKAKGVNVNIQKCDPYFNVDAGTLNPAEHGETFVTKDGAETDLDLGHYERFLNIELTHKSSTMSGRIIRQVIDDERAGKYLGKTVQIIPHVTNAMQTAIIDAGKGFDVHIVEVGGTVGDYESTAFIEALRQLRHKVGSENVMYVHVVYLPYLVASGEIKSKPAQNAVRDLREAGIHADILVARADHEVGQGILNKLSLYSDIPVKAVIPMPTVSTVYEVPLLLAKLGLGERICEKLDICGQKADLKEWKSLVKNINKTEVQPVRIGIIAKYLDHQDTYASVVEALKSACWSTETKLDAVWINAEEITATNVHEKLKNIDGILVPGGFGVRGVEGKIAAATYALEHNVPYLGLCLGMQVAAIAGVRKNGKTKAHSTEFEPDAPDPVVDLMQSQKAITDMGGTMRLGNYECKLEPKSKVAVLYGKTTIYERHRHRYEFNNKYEKDLNAQNIQIVGRNPQTNLAEVIEAKNHPYFIATQYHPEFTSRPLAPHPLFVGLIQAAIS